MIPHANTVKFKCCEWLHANPGATAEQVLRNLSRNKRSVVFRHIDEMTATGMLISASGVLTCGRNMQRHFDQIEANKQDKPEVQIVPPRHVNLFTPPMTGYKLNVFGTRPEALEIMQARSKHL